MDKKFELKEEQLDILKKQINRGNAKIYREEYSKNITYTLPVKVEDLIIEQNIDGKNEKTRIPISEETYDFNKQNHIINDINIYKNEFQDIQHIETELKKEELKIKETDY